MRNRPIRCEVCFNEEENERLLMLCEKTKLSKAQIIRYLLLDYIPPEAPPIEHRKLIKELRMIGNNINQLLHLARLNGILNPKELQKHLDKLNLIEDEMHTAYEPKKRE